MNEVRLSQGHHSSHLMGGGQDMDEQMAVDFAQRAGSDHAMMASHCMRERMSMGPTAGHMMRLNGHQGKMPPAYGAGAGMLMNLGGHMGRGPMSFIAAQPPCLPFAIPGSGYGAGGVPGAGMGGAAGSFDMLHRTAGPQPAKHNKYCHFCQHVKVRASGMLACCNKDCTRRFCEHCLSKSIGDDVNPQTSAAWVNGQWHCPVCRKLCCCAIGDCDKNHRHCKAYRYRVRRAEQQAVKRAGTSGGGEGGSPRGSPRAKSDSASGIKPEQAVEISEEKPLGGGGRDEGGAHAASLAMAGVSARARHGAEAGSNDLAAFVQGASSLEQGARTMVKAEDPSAHDEQGLAFGAGSASPASSMAMPAAAGGLSPSQLSVHGPNGMPHRLRQVRRGDMEGAGAGGNVDLSDVQTMADSWLRLLEVAHTSSCTSPPPPVASRRSRSCFLQSCCFGRWLAAGQQQHPTGCCLAPSWACCLLLCSVVGTCRQA